MLIRQSKNTFIRTTPNYGYVVNQLNYQDRTYDEAGAIFLSEISRIPQDIDEIVNKLLKKFTGVNFEILKKDLLDFLKSLEKDKFVITGRTPEELDMKDENFSYNVALPNTIKEDFSQVDVPNQNIKTTQDFFKEEVQGRPLISTLQFELSSRCNERCIHCYIPNAKKNHGIDMPLHKVKSIIDEFADMGGINITLSGGEVLLHHDLVSILKYCREKDLKITLLSNLISLTLDHVKIFKEVNISLIQVSLYSMDPVKHDIITTVKGSWEKTKNAIELLVANNIPVQISCPLMKANKEGYKEVLKYAQSLKIKAQTDYIMMAQSDLNTSNLSNRLSVDEIGNIIREIALNDIDYKESILTNLPPSTHRDITPEKFKDAPLCSVGYDNCCIAANGDVYPCAGWQDYILGNIYRQTLKDIWENSERVKQLRKITQKSFPQCLECDALDYCARCLVRNYNESGGDMFKINQHFCNVAHINKKILEEEFGPEIERRERLLEKKLKSFSK